MCLARCSLSAHAPLPLHGPRLGPGPWCQPLGEPSGSEPEPSPANGLEFLPAPPCPPSRSPAPAGHPACWQTLDCLVLPALSSRHCHLLLPGPPARDSFCVCGASSLALHEASEAPIGHWGLPLAARGSRDAGPCRAVPARALIPYPMPQSHLVAHNWKGSRLVGARAWGKGWPRTSLRGIPGGPAPQEGWFTRGVASWVQWKGRPGANRCP